MAKTGREVVFEGWLTKSPPTKRIWRARWRRRWFSLTHSGELPGQFVLSYYTDRNKRKQKGVIDLDHCEQVDLGLKLEERKLKFDHVFDIKTPTRTYYLAADTEGEMKSWVNCICRVCSLKATADDDDSHISINASCNAVDRTEIVRNNQSSALPTAVSTSPYIPISECITGTSPILDPQDLKALLAHNLKNSIYQNQFQSNNSYELPARNYINYVNDSQDPRFYDSPRKLGPRPEARNESNEKEDLHSPNDCDSDSVFADDDDFDHNTSAELNTSKKSRPSDSSTDVDMTVTQKFTKIRVSEGGDAGAKAPPRPPKPSHIASNYFKPNVQKSDNPDIDQVNCCSKYPENQKLITDDMYDFPRSHQGTLRNSSSRNHLYNNAASANVEEQIFEYDSSPKTVSVSGQVFKYDPDDLTGVERSSPLSEGHPVAAYSNLPSPLLADSQLMPPPVVNRDLKPRRKLSDSPSIYSNAEPPSPRACQYGTQKKPGKEPGCHRRAAPSPVPSDSLPSDGVEEQIYHFLPGGDSLARMQYLDLTFEPAADVQPLSKPTVPRPRTPDHTTEYKEVDFMKTQAFNLTRNNLEMERSKGEEYGGSKRGIDK